MEWGSTQDHAISGVTVPNIIPFQAGQYQSAKYICNGAVPKIVPFQAGQCPRLCHFRRGSINLPNIYVINLGQCPRNALSGTATKVSQNIHAISAPAILICYKYMVHHGPCPRVYHLWYNNPTLSTAISGVVLSANVHIPSRA